MDCTYSPVDFFYSSICHYCKEPSNELKKCGFCKTFFFCNKKHAKQYWIYHKRLCKIIKESKHLISYEVGCSKQEFQAYKINLKNIWEEKLQRPLKPFEHQVWMFLKVCNVCFASENLYLCPDCMVVFYCSKKCENFDSSHKSFCKQLKVCLDIDRLLFDNNSNNKTIDFEMNELESILKGSNSLLDFKNNFFLKFNQLETDCILKYDIITPAVLIIHALETSNKIKNRLYFSSTMVLHFAGSDSYEMSLNWPLILEFLFHYVTNLKLIQIYLIGPQIDYENECNEFPLYFCNECKTKNVNATIFPKKALYHEAVPLIIKPHMIFSFNSGLHEFHNHEYDTWKLSIPFLLNKNAPLVLTAYTENELKKDVARIINVKKNVKVVLDIQENQCKSNRPMRNWDFENDPIFYNNYYMTIIST